MTWEKGKNSLVSVHRNKHLGLVCAINKCSYLIYSITFCICSKMLSASSRTSGEIEEVKLTFKAKSAGPLPGKSVF